MTAEKDPIGRLFAQLTGQLEDATELATFGQNRNLTAEKRSNFAMRLRRRLKRADQTLDRIDLAIAVHREGEK